MILSIREIYNKYKNYFDLNIGSLIIYDNGNKIDNNLINIDLLERIHNTDQNYYHKQYIYFAILSYYITIKLNNVQLGGTNKNNSKQKIINYKLNKYAHKFIKSNTKIYKQKYYYYLNESGKYDYNFINTIINQNNNFDQLGGFNGHYYNETSDPTIINIVDNDNIKIIAPNIDCNNLAPNFSCSTSPDPVNLKLNDFMKNNAFYNFRKYFKTLMTDAYMKTLSEDARNGPGANFLYNKLTYFVYIHLNLALSQLIYIINKKRINIYPNSIDDINDSDIKLMYKGGNTIRIHLEYIKKKYNNLNLPINNLYDRKDIGDWDYSLQINYKSLSDKKIPIDSFLSKIKRTIAFSLSYIKLMLTNILPANNFYNNYLIEVRRLLLEQKTQTIKTNYINNYNSYIPVGILNDRITDITINKIIITDFNQKLELQQLNPIDYAPAQVFPLDGNTNLKSFEEYEINHSNDETKKLKEEIDIVEGMGLVENYIYIAFMDSIKLVFFTSLNDFSLFRLKINNKLEYIEEKNNIINRKNLNVPIEIIDVSINTINDNQLSSLYYKLYGFEKFKLYTFNLLNDFEIEIELPSILYMFYDVACMVFQNNIFPWLELKYEKRIERLCQLYVLNYLKDNNTACLFNIHHLINYIDELFKINVNGMNICLINKYKDMLINFAINQGTDPNIVRQRINSPNLIDREFFINSIKNLQIDAVTQLELKNILIEIYETKIKMCSIESISNNLNINKNDVNETTIPNFVTLNYIDIKTPLIDQQLNIILANLYSSIILLLYLFDDYKLSLLPVHYIYAHTYYLKYERCAINQICTNLKNDVFNMNNIKNNKFNYISELVIYIIYLKIKFSDSMILISGNNLAINDNIIIDIL